APPGRAALALLPVILAIHLWRVRHRRYEVASTLLWSRVLSETPLHRPRHLPTRYVLLALQLAALAGGAVALARPSWVAAGAHRYELVTSGNHAVLARALASLSQGYGPSSLATDGPLLAGLMPQAGGGRRKTEGGSGRLPSSVSRREEAVLFAPLGTDRRTLEALGRIV